MTPDYCDECGDLWPCQHDTPPLDEVEREDHGGWTHGYWAVTDA